MFLQRTKKGGISMTEKQKKQIKEIVGNMQDMTLESIIILKGAAEVLKIRDSMEHETKKAG